MFIQISSGKIKSPANREIDGELGATTTAIREYSYSPKRANLLARLLFSAFSLLRDSIYLVLTEVALSLSLSTLVILLCLAIVSLLLYVWSAFPKISMASLARSHISRRLFRISMKTLKSLKHIRNIKNRFKFRLAETSAICLQFTFTFQRPPSLCSLTFVIVFRLSSNRLKFYLSVLVTRSLLIASRLNSPSPLPVPHSLSGCFLSLASHAGCGILI